MLGDGPSRYAFRRKRFSGAGLYAGGGGILFLTSQEAFDQYW